LTISPPNSTMRARAVSSSASNQSMAVSIMSSFASSFLYSAQPRMPRMCPRHSRFR
jgi:hypothetical protein